MKTTFPKYLNWKNISIFLVLTITPSSLAQAADWQLFFENPQAKHYVNKNSVITLSGEKVRAWKKQESNSTGGGTHSLYEIDCRERKYTLRALEPLDKNDIEAIKAFETAMRNWKEPNQAWEYLGVSDLDEALYETWCKSYISNRKQ